MRKGTNDDQRGSTQQPEMEKNKQDAQGEWRCQGKRKGRGVGEVRDKMDNDKSEQRYKTRKFLFFSEKNFLM